MPEDDYHHWVGFTCWGQNAYPYRGVSDRRLMNTSPDPVPVMKEALISDFNMLLYRTGHSFKYRVDVIKRALKKYEEKFKSGR